MSHLASEDFCEITSEDQYPETLSLCSTSHCRQNWKCVLLTCLICSCLLSVLYCHRQQSNQVALNHDYSSNKNLCWVLVFCAVILYSLYLMECSYATEQIQLYNRKTEPIEKVKERIERMKNSDPVIWWKATCYHYARRKRRTAQYRRGTYFVSSKVYHERVNSFTSNSTFNFSCCGVSDISNNLILNENSRPIVKFSFSKGFAFANMVSAIDFEEQRSMFFRELRRYDDYMDIHEGLDLTDCSNFQEVVAINTRCGKRPWYANTFYYWLYSCFLLSWPFRIVQLYNTAYVHFKITKLFGVNYNNLTESTQQLAMLQLYGSYSMDNMNHNNTPGTPNWLDRVPIGGSAAHLEQVTTTLVPSYSEALLLDNNVFQPTPDSSTEALDKDDSTTINSKARHISPRLSLFRTPRHRTFSSADESVNNKNEPNLGMLQHQAGSVPDVNAPPNYEDALMFPIIEHPTCSCTNSDINAVRVSAIAAVSTFSSTTSASNFVQADDQTQILSLHQETRLPNTNSRTFLSIETSL